MRAESPVNQFLTRRLRPCRDPANPIGQATLAALDARSGAAPITAVKPALQAALRAPCGGVHGRGGAQRFVENSGSSIGERATLNLLVSGTCSLQPDAA